LLIVSLEFLFAMAFTEARIVEVSSKASYDIDLINSGDMEDFYEDRDN
jgi:hypothetical protein